KAIDAENLKLDNQARLLDRIGARAGAPSSAAQAPPTEIGGAPAAPTGPLDLGAIGDKLQSVADAIKRAASDIPGAQKDTTVAALNVSTTFIDERSNTYSTICTEEDLSQETAYVLAGNVQYYKLVLTLRQL